jgi:hypothetical protein
MKKNLWVLLALSALIAMFVIAGCAPKPSPSPTPTPTATPTTPVDTAAPKVVSTTVYKYGASLCETCGGALYEECEGYGGFKIVIDFNENIDTLMSSCLYNPSSWDVWVKNSGRYGTPLVNIQNIEINGKRIVITAQAWETDTLRDVYTLVGESYQMTPYLYCGLICNTIDAKAYANEVNNNENPNLYIGLWKAPTAADSVNWKLVKGCFIADEFGNLDCNYSDSDCCLEATCETCVDECPFGDPTCATCENPCQ